MIRSQTQWIEENQKMIGTKAEENQAWTKTKSKQKNKNDWDDIGDLDEEMEEIFHPASDHFSIADLTSDKPVEASPHFDEIDYDLHRRESFQYHQPLRKLYHKHRKSSYKRSGRGIKKDDEKVQFYVGSLPSLENSAALTLTLNDTLKGKVPLKSSLRGPTNISLSGRLSVKTNHLTFQPFQSPTIEPRISEEETTLQDEPTESTQKKTVEETAAEIVESMKHKVKFLLGEESREDLQKSSTESSRMNRYKQSRRHSVKRRHHGFNIIDAKSYNTVLEPEEAETLQTCDIDDMASESSFDDPKGMRRHRVKDIKDKNGTSTFELHELKEYELTDSVEWRQTARWIKYEEDVELGPDKWGKPHVPPLSFRSLLKLRQCLDSGGVLLDLEEKDVMSISKKLHVNEKLLPALRRNSSGYGNLNLLSHDKNSRSPMFLKSLKSKQENETVHSENNEESSIPPETVILMPSDNNINNVEVIPASKRKSVAYEKTLEQNIQGIQRRIPIKVRFLFVLLGPSESSLDYHEIGRSIGALMSNENFHTAARKSLVPPRRLKEEPSKEEPDKPVYDPLHRTGKIFSGFVQDIKNRYPWYLSDFFRWSESAMLCKHYFYLFFASVSGAVAFGGLLADKTGNNIGVSETLIGTSISGVIFSLFRQPLIIIGTTAPLVLIDETLYKFQESFASHFLVIRTWMGIWVAVISILMVAAEGSVLVKFFSRFMQEIYATIISLIFIAEAFTKLTSILLIIHFSLPIAMKLSVIVPTLLILKLHTRPVPQPNTALLSMILMIGTFYIAYFLRHFRNSKFLGRSVVPEGFNPSTDRSWGLVQLPITLWEVALAAVWRSSDIYFTIYGNTNLRLIISKKQLKKGSGFHLDMVMVGVLNMLNGFIGCPWQCAAAVRSITHTSSLVVLSKTHAPGETPRIIEVKEQRFFSMFMSPVLRQVPQATLFGVFLYMGVSALSGIHLYERFLLIFMPTKHHPEFNFVRR
ncbi:anion exchange protein 2 [Caerostris extrusa]|uniref:Anion exchange protein 2 n=1 Tax=Caerostris extrusa TaxID=172846 RepID=A0AAV4SEE9_CAEEX|nr:anion exchange protein 2 [Caerostris extrusa]